MLSISDYGFYLFHDGPVLFWSTIDVMDWSGVGKWAGLQFVLLDESMAYEHTCCARVEEGGGGNGA